ncbi:MAG: type II CAAX endopeptidase family protein, partial [Terriglobales bacterium]
MDEAKGGSFSENTGPAGQQLNQSDLGLATASPPSLHTPVHNIFIDDHGLRAGWRFLLYVGLWRVFLILIPTLVRYVQPHEAHGIWQELIAELEFLASAVLPTLVMAAIEKRSFGDYGLPRKYAFGKSFWVGTVWGIVAVTVLVLAIGGVGDFSLSGLALHGTRIFKFAVFWGGFFLVVGFFEEYLLRGYPQFTLTQGMGFWPAAILLSSLFAALHLGNSG